MYVLVVDIAALYKTEENDKRMEAPQTPITAEARKACRTIGDLLGKKNGVESVQRQTRTL